MPIIKDPKMNPTEKAFGLVYIEKYDAHFKYFKKRNSDNRFLAAGSIVEIDKNSIILYQNTIVIQGMIVKGDIKGDFENSTTAGVAPIVNWLKANGTDTLDQSKLDELMAGNSEVPPV